jgi:hypothetical protein
MCQERSQMKMLKTAARWILRDEPVRPHGLFPMMVISNVVTASPVADPSVKLELIAPSGFDFRDLPNPGDVIWVGGSAQWPGTSL